MAETLDKNVIQGDDIVVEIDGKTMLHANEHTLKLSPQFKEFRTKDTNGNEKSPGDVDWSVDVSGFVVIDPTITNTITPDEIVDIILSKKRVKVTLKSKPSATGAFKTREGFGYFSDFSIGAKSGENTTYSGAITSSGDLKPQVSTLSAQSQEFEEQNGGIQ